MTYAPFRELTTRRLLLRKLRREDAPAFFHRLASSEAVTKYMLFQPHRELSESQESVEKALARYETGRFYRWCITQKDHGELIGIIDLLRFDEARNACSFAYMLSADCWNQGYGTEALQAVLDFAFREMGIATVLADHMAGNPASGAVMRKVGMVPLGVTPGKYEKNGTRHDAVEYRITAPCHVSNA